MPISVSCPVCGTQYNVKDEAAGKQFKCKICGNFIPVPKREIDSEEDFLNALDEAADEESKAARNNHPDNVGKQDAGAAIASPQTPARTAPGRA